MSNSLWLALGIVLIVEGLGPLVAPKGWRAMIALYQRAIRPPLKTHGRLSRGGGRCDCLCV